MIKFISSRLSEACKFNETVSESVGAREFLTSDIISAATFLHIPSVSSFPLLLFLYLKLLFVRNNDASGCRQPSYTPRTTWTPADGWKQMWNFYILPLKLISHVLFGTVVNTVSTSCSIHSSSFLDATVQAAVCLNVLVNTLVYLLSELFCIHLHAQYMK